MARRSDHTRPELKRMAIESAGKIIEANGLRALSIRRIAEAIGYKSGTLYQMFENLDELIVEVHIVTLEAMYLDLSRIEQTDDPEASMLALARGYTTEVSQNRNRWSALFGHSLPDTADLPEHYTKVVGKLIELVARTLRPIFAKGEEGEEQSRHEARVLWASFYGIISLDTVNKLPNFEQVDDITKSLVKNYVAGLRALH
jgi:AcrR family transcriptional regulator